MIDEKPLPSWQATPCPTWCVWAPHDESEHPDDRMHASAELRRPLSMEPAQKLVDDSYEAEFTTVYLYQHYREGEPHVVAGKGETTQTFQLTLGEAEELAECLLAVVRLARRG